MKLEGKILVNKSEDEVWKFFNDLNNLVKWDHSVDRAEITSHNGSNAVGLTFDTIGPSSHNRPGLKTSYKIIDVVPNKSADTMVTYSNMFREAVWKQSTEETNTGTIITISVEFKLRTRYFLFYPIIFLRKSAIDRDLGFLKEEIEKTT